MLLGIVLSMLEVNCQLYCATCEKLVCYKCVIRAGEHQDHDYKELEIALQEYRAKMSSYLEPMQKQVVTMKKALAEIDTCCGEISDQQTAIKDRIHAQSGQLQEILTSRETKLINDLDKLTQGKLQSLASQRDQIETTLAKVISSIDFTRENLRGGTKTGALIINNQTIEQVKELAIPRMPDDLEPCTEADIIFSASEDLIEACKNYGEVMIPCSPDPSKCDASGVGTEVAVAGENSTFVLHCANFNGKPCELVTRTLQCEVLSEITGFRANCSLRRGRQGRYEISYRPTIKGRHQLHILIEVQHIRGSPFTVAVKSPVENLSTPIRTLGGMDGPWGVAVTQKGEVMVTEWGGHCMSVFSLAGEKLRSIGTQGTGNGRFNGPRGIAVDGEGNILVVDNFNHRIQKFTAGGQFIAAAGTKDRGYPNFSSPSGIAFNTSNKNVYIADTGAHHVIILSSDLTYIKSFGESGIRNGRFDRPLGIACDSTGKVYVADNGNHRIQVFTAEGEFLKMLGVESPNCVAIDANDMVYVSESGSKRVSVFTSTGRFMTSFGRHRGAPGQFKWPMGLVVDTSGVVYVCDHYTNKVSFY